MKKCVTDEQGHPIAFYDTTVHSEDAIPSEAFEISDEDWRDCIEHPRCRRFVDGDLVECRMDAGKPVDLEHLVEERIEADPVFGALLEVMSEETGVSRDELASRIASRVGAS